MSGPEVRRGLRAGHVRKGRPGTWEACRLHAINGRRGRPTQTTPGHTAAVPPAASERTSGHGVVLPSEGNRARRDGRQESERLIVPTKPGNRPYGTRWREAGAGSWNRRRER